MSCANIQAAMCRPQSFGNVTDLYREAEPFQPREWTDERFQKLDGFEALLCELVMPSLEYNFDVCAVLASFVAPPVGRLEGKTGERPKRAVRIVLSKDDQFLLTLDDGSKGYGVKLWRTADWKLLRTWPWNAPGGNIAISPNNKYVALTAINARSFEVWDWRNNECILKKQHTECFGSSIVFSPDSSKLAIDWTTACEYPTCCKDCQNLYDGYTMHLVNMATVWDLETGEFKSFCTHGDNPKGMFWSDDGLLYIDSGRHGARKRYKAWNVETEECVKILPEMNLLSGSTQCVSRLGNSLLTCNCHEGVKLWNIDGEEGKFVRSWYFKTAQAVCFSSNGDFALTLDKPRGKTCWDTPTTGTLTRLNLKTYDKTVILPATPHTEETHYWHGDLCITKNGAFAIFTGLNSWVQILHLDSNQLW